MEVVRRRSYIDTFFNVKLWERYTPLLYRRVKKGETSPLWAEPPMVKLSDSSAIRDAVYANYPNDAEHLGKHGDLIRPMTHTLVLRQEVVDDGDGTLQVNISLLAKAFYGLLVSTQLPPDAWPGWLRYRDHFIANMIDQVSPNGEELIQLHQGCKVCKGTAHVGNRICWARIV